MDALEIISSIAGNPTATVALVGVAVGAGSFGAGLYQYRKAQKWERLRFLTEQIERLHSDEALSLGLKFLDWHDRMIVLPKKYCHFGQKDGIFEHTIANMSAAMDVNNRIDDPKTGIFDLKVEFRKPPYTLYVEVFDRFFDFLSEVQVFREEKLIKDYRLIPVEYIVQRLDALHIFDGYIKGYQLADIRTLIDSCKPKQKVSWVNNALWASWSQRLFSR